MAGFDPHDRWSEVGQWIVVNDKYETIADGFTTFSAANNWIERKFKKTIDNGFSPDAQVIWDQPGWSE